MPSSRIGAIDGAGLASSDKRWGPKGGKSHGGSSEANQRGTLIAGGERARAPHRNTNQRETHTERDGDGRDRDLRQGATSAVSGRRKRTNAKPQASPARTHGDPSAHDIAAPIFAPRLTPPESPLPTSASFPPLSIPRKGEGEREGDRRGDRDSSPPWRAESQGNEAQQRKSTSQRRENPSWPRAALKTVRC